MKKLKLIFVFFLFVTISIVAQQKKYETYTTADGETLQSIAQKFSITPYNLLQLNPDLAEIVILSAGTIVIVPNKNFVPGIKQSSNDGKDYVENGFIIHTVQPKENYFRLNKKYGCRKRVLRKHNPALRVEGLKVGQIIKIPVPKGYEDEIKTSEVIVLPTKPYLVKPREGKFGISKRFAMSVTQFEELNPQTKGRDLKMAELIVVPDIEELPEVVGISYHRIQKDETFFSLGELYDLTEEELIAANPELIDGVKAGMLLKIPLLTASLTSQFQPLIAPGKHLDVVLMLPFMAHKQVDFEKNRTADIATDFYLGALMALDSVKKLGLSVHMKVYDTQNDRTKISSLLSTGSVRNSDVIIGPLFYGNVQFVSSILKTSNIAIVSPLSQKEHASIANEQLIQIATDENKMIDITLDHIKANYKDENIVIFTDTSRVSTSKLYRILKILQPLDSLKPITVIKPQKGYIKPELFREKIVEDRDNIMLLVSDDGILIKDVVQNLGVLPTKINATLFGFNKGSNYNDVDNNDLARVNFHYTTTGYIDYDDNYVKDFMAKYQRLNFAIPSEYAFKGFDMTYDILLRLGTYDEISKALYSGISERTSSRFHYEKTGDTSGFINKGIFMMKYDGLHIVKVDYSSSTESTIIE